jgi:hypothetical protein
MMKSMSRVVLAALVLMSAPRAVSAQVKTIPDESITATAVVEAIEAKSRTLTVRNEDGTVESLVVPPEVKRFSALKVGDKITVHYYSSLIVKMKKPGEPAVDVDHAALTPSEGTRPGGTIANQRTLTVTITAIDPAIPSITVKSANGWTYSRKVLDKKALAQVKVGDKLDLTWNDAVLISFAEAKK